MRAHHLTGITLALVFSLCTALSLVDTVRAHSEIRSASKENHMMALGGATDKKTDLEALAKLVGDDKVFSTYSSGLEAVLGQFQPAGNDYIIHVLGDSAREKYVANFIDGDYLHVTNPTLAQSHYMGWVRQANWFFFRELYVRYDLIGQIGYLEHWMKIGGDNFLNNSVSIEIIKTENGQYRIVCQADAPIEAVVDVFLSYNIVSNYKRKGMFRTLCSVGDPTFARSAPGVSPNYNLPGSADNLAVPITLIDGRGEIFLTPYPLGYTALEDVKATVNAVIDNPYAKNLRALGRE